MPATNRTPFPTSSAMHFGHKFCRSRGSYRGCMRIASAGARCRCCLPLPVRGGRVNAKPDEAESAEMQESDSLIRYPRLHCPLICFRPAMGEQERGKRRKKHTKCVAIVSAADWNGIGTMHKIAGRSDCPSPLPCCMLQFRGYGRMKSKLLFFESVFFVLLWLLGRFRSTTSRSLARFFSLADLVHGKLVGDALLCIFFFGSLSPFSVVLVTAGPYATGSGLAAAGLSRTRSTKIWRANRVIDAFRDAFYLHPFPSPLLRAVATWNLFVVFFFFFQFCSLFALGCLSL